MTEWIFWASAAVVVYTYAGYPVILALLAKWAPGPPIQRGPARLRASIVVVAHDEALHIERKILDCLEQRYPPELLEVLVASDGSRDRTEEIVEGYATKGVRLFRLTGPRGKPAALNHVVPLAKGDVIVLTDARQRLDPEAVSALVENFADPSVGAVSGELHIQGSSDSVTGGGVGAYWRLEKWMRRLEARLDSTVGATGALYAIRRELFRALPEEIILDDVAIPMAVARTGHRVVFESRARAFDTAATVSGEFRRKVRTLAGNLQLVWVEPWLLNPWKNRLWWPLVSHKLARLAVPWALGLLLAATFVLGVWVAPPRTLYLGAFVGQVCFYCAGLVGWLLERRGTRWRLPSFAAAFCLLNAAALVALLQFLLGRSRVTWKNGGSPVGDRGPREP